MMRRVKGMSLEERVESVRAPHATPLRRRRPRGDDDRAARGSAGPAPREIEELQVPVLNHRSLIELKRHRGSHLDLADIEAIEALREL